MKNITCLLSGCLAAIALVGCSNIEKAPPTPKSARADSTLTIDVPEIMAGTVASQAVVMGYEPMSSAGYRPVIARGYGLVVGLNGTGSRDIPPQLRAHMLREAAKGGFGNQRFGDLVAGLSPEELLDSMDTAVVIVEAIVPQGAVAGTRFDVRVYAHPQTSTTSLEGGRLYTTSLRPGRLTTGGAQAFPLAEASGPIFVNPFAEPNAVGRDTVSRTSGRILNGGIVLKDMPLKLRLAHPSHARAAIICTAINTRFPQEPGQANPTARGESDESIELTVPPSYADRAEEFIELVRHTTISQSNPEAVAMSIRRAVLSNALVARAATLRWQALGTRAIPIIQGLYDHSEEVPRLAALHAGAKLDDGMVIPHLINMAEAGTLSARQEAIRLLADMRVNPRIDQALRGLLNAEDTEVRLQAYEALVKRRDPYMQRINVDGKYVIDIVESDKPLIYITQVGQPRIVIFGKDLAIDRPVTVAAWSNQFMIKGDSDDELVEVYYRAPGEAQGTIMRVAPNLPQFVHFLGHVTTIERPEPGLGLTYGQAVGALHQIWTQKYINADFKAEQDRILAAILRQEQEDRIADRPEFTAAPETDSGSDLPLTTDLGRMSEPHRPVTASGHVPTPSAEPATPIPQNR